MKIRIGFVTNSSSTNFLIISKNELTRDFLFDQLGFIRGGQLEHWANQLCLDIFNGIDAGLKYHDGFTISSEAIKNLFGERAAKYFQQHKGFHTYVGHTNSDDSLFTQFFTTDSFEIEKHNFYLNGRSCLW